MAQYVEKMRVPVKVRLFGGDSFEGWLSVAPHSAIREGSETLLELLNSPLRVLPFILADDDSVMLLTRQYLDSVEPLADADPDQVSPPQYLVTREELVAVEWLDGHRAEGRIPMELPRDLNRASDFLNDDDDFFPLITLEGTQLVNKLRLRAVRIFSVSPRPAVVVIPFNAA